MSLYILTYLSFNKPQLWQKVLQYWSQDSLLLFHLLLLLNSLFFTKYLNCHLDLSKHDSMNRSSSSAKCCPKPSNKKSCFRFIWPDTWYFNYNKGSWGKVSRFDNFFIRICNVLAILEISPCRCRGYFKHLPFGGIEVVRKRDSGLWAFSAFLPPAFLLVHVLVGYQCGQIGRFLKLLGNKFATQK